MHVSDRLDVVDPGRDDDPTYRHGLVQLCIQDYVSRPIQAVGRVHPLLLSDDPLYLLVVIQRDAHVGCSGQVQGADNVHTGAVLRSNARSTLTPIEMKDDQLKPEVDCQAGTIELVTNSGVTCFRDDFLLWGPLHQADVAGTTRPCAQVGREDSHDRDQVLLLLLQRPDLVVPVVLGRGQQRAVDHNRNQRPGQPCEGAQVRVRNPEEGRASCRTDQSEPVHRHIQVGLRVHIQARTALPPTSECRQNHRQGLDV